MKIVITGGAGFIGSNLAEELSKDNEIIVLDDLFAGKLSNIRDLDIKFVKGSITDLDLLQKLFKDVEYVFHQAAIASVPRSINDPVASNNANINGTLNVLVAAKDSGVKKVICASSSSVYGDTPELPKREEMKPTPKSPYAITKLAGEYYSTVFSEVYGLKTVSLRYFNVYGPKQDPSSEYAAVIPKFIRKAQENKPPIIYGDGEQTRDFTFVKDVVNANILALERGEGVFNIASGSRISINELADKIIAMYGKSLKPIHESPRPGDVKHSLADISKAEKELRYKPEYVLEEGLRETIEYEE